MADSHRLLETLTKREKEVLVRLAQGMTNRDIADQLVISVDTVHWYTKQIYRKLDVTSRTQASLLAKDLGLLGLKPTKVADRVDNTLPVYTSSFIGRVQELAYLDDLISQRKARLITILGWGGVGKTRLAIEVAQRQHKHFPDGVFFIPLGDSTTMYESFLETLRRFLRLQITTEDKEITIFSTLHDQKMLLIFDQFEPAIQEKEQIAQLLRYMPETLVLITSQISLGLQQEWLVHLDGLGTDTVDSLNDAARLFVERVRRVKPEFEPQRHEECIREICWLLEGVPLALELAANWLKTLSCNDMLNELRTNLALLKTDATDVEKRHRSFETVFEHAWMLLSEQEQSILRRLSVFRGEFSLTAAMQVAGTSLEILSVLVDRSFILQTATGSYRMHGLLRQYAEQKLKSRQVHSKLSGVALAMSALLHGEFDEVESLATELMNESTDDLNLDKGFGLALLGVIAGVNEDYTRCLQLCQSSLVVTEEATIPLLFSHLGLSIGFIGLEDHISAWRTIRYALEAAFSLQISGLLILCFPIVAIVKAYEANLEEAIHLVSLALKNQEILPQWMLGWEPFVRLNKDLQEAIESSRFSALWQHGTELEPYTVVQALLL